MDAPWRYQLLFSGDRRPLKAEQKACIEKQLDVVVEVLESLQTSSNSEIKEAITRLTPLKTINITLYDHTYADPQGRTIEKEPRSGVNAMWANSQGGMFTDPFGNSLSFSADYNLDGNGACRVATKSEMLDLLVTPADDIEPKEELSAELQALSKKLEAISGKARMTFGRASRQKTQTNFQPSSSSSRTTQFYVPDPEPVDGKSTLIPIQPSDPEL